MLQNIRDKSTGWIAYVIVIGISIPFALWGIDQYFTGGNLIVAEVNKTKISVERLNNEYQDRLREMKNIVSSDQNEAEAAAEGIDRAVPEAVANHESAETHLGFVQLNCPNVTTR